MANNMHNRLMCEAICPAPTGCSCVRGDVGGHGSSARCDECKAICPTPCGCSCVLGDVGGRSGRSYEHEAICPVPLGCSCVQGVVPASLVQEVNPPRGCKGKSGRKTAGEGEREKTLRGQKTHRARRLERARRSHRDRGGRGGGKGGGRKKGAGKGVRKSSVDSDGSL